MTDKMKSFVKGILLGMVGKPLPQGKEPIGYFYGHIAKEGETATRTIDGVGYVGEVLPKLPEWDKEAYPYACIGYLNTSVSSLFVCQQPFEHIGKTTVAHIPSEATFVENGQWAYWRIMGAVMYFSRGVIWTSHDILNEDGSIYLDDEDCVCIPIYE